MADFLSGLGGLMKGFTSIIPQDDPNVKLLGAQSELDDLIKKQDAAYARIGKKLAASSGLSAYPDEAAEIELLEANIARARRTLDELTEQKQAQEREEAEQQRARDEADKALTCPECGFVNAQGVKFCQECGTKLGAPGKLFCTSCGAENAPGTRFCGECGARLGG